MAASVNDVLQKQGVAGTLTTLSAPGHSVAGTTITVGSTTNWPIDTGITFAIRTVDASGNFVAGTYTEWRATVSGSTLIGMVLVYGTDQIYAAGTTTQVYIPVSAYSYNRMIDALIVGHSQLDGSHVPSLPLTTPKITTSINDANGNEVIKTPATASAVNEITVTNAATGNDPKIEATGGDTNASVRISGKGTGGVILSSGSHARAIISATDVASSVNYHLMYGSATGGSIQHAAAGTDTNISFNIASKGSGEVAVNNVAFSGAWQSYTPTFANTTNVNGTVSGAYKQIGKTVFFRAAFILGSSSTVGTTPTVSLPVTSVAPTSVIMPIGICHFYDNSASATVEGDLRWSSTTTAGIQVSTVTAAATSYIRNDAVTAAVPFVWATSDAILITGSYEAA